MQISKKIFTQRISTLSKDVIILTEYLDRFINTITIKSILYYSNYVFKDRVIKKEYSFVDKRLFW